MISIDCDMCHGNVCEQAEMEYASRLLIYCKGHTLANLQPSMRHQH